MKKRIPSRIPAQYSSNTVLPVTKTSTINSDSSSLSPAVTGALSQRPRSSGNLVTSSIPDVAVEGGSNQNGEKTSPSSNSGTGPRSRRVVGGAVGNYNETPTAPQYPRPLSSGSYGSRRGLLNNQAINTPPRAASALQSKRSTPLLSITSPSPPDQVPATVASRIRQTPTPSFPAFLVPPPREEDKGKLVVALDLDETLIFSRGNRVFERQGVSKLLQALKGRAEVIVWTAGTRDYALDVIRIIDPYFAVQHCIYRHPMWWNGEIGCTKDLRMLGRPMDRVILIDNTPEVFRANPDKGILVSDFFGKESVGLRGDRPLGVLADIFEYVLVHLKEPKTADVLASHRLQKRVFRLDGRRRVEIFTVIGDRHEALR